MSLVDYDASDDEAVEEEEEEEQAKGFHDNVDEEEKENRFESVAPSPSPSYPPSDRRNQLSIAMTREHLHAATSSPPSLEELPDVSDLLGSTPFQSHQMVSGDQSSRVAVAVAENSSRKRESNGSVFPPTSTKHPRGDLRRLRNVPDTMGGLLVPPQLRGRSNVVTEDIGKLFASKRAEPSH